MNDENNENNDRQNLPDEPNEPFASTSFTVPHRLLVIGLYLSFLACVAALWLTGNFFGDPGHILPYNVANFIANRHVAVLLFPLLGLLGCYCLLRSITHDIMASPERYLDERQKMVRDKAHRNAYKIVKVACFLVPFYLCLHALFWAGQAPAPTVTSVVHTTAVPSYISYGVLPIRISGATASPADTIMVFSSNVQQTTIKGRQVIHLYAWEGSESFLILHESVPMSTTYTVLSKPNPLVASWPNDPTSLLFYYGVLLLVLFLMMLALPMSIVAWKRATVAHNKHETP
jgi:hypothetical protein